MRRWVAIAAFASGFAAGCPDSEFHCSKTADCVSGDEEGFCEPNGFCSFVDPDCESGRRYGELAGDLAFMCTPPEVAGTTGIGPSATTTDAGGVSSGPPPETTSSQLDGTTTESRGETSSGPAEDSSSGRDLTTTSSSGSSSTGDSPPVSVVTFGERDDADFQGVTSDTYLSFWDPEHNRGAHVDLHVHGSGEPWEVSLLRFDVSALSEVEVFSVELLIHNEDEFEPGVVTVHSVLEAWIEGAADGDPGVCNWTARDFDNLWSSGGAQDPAHDGEVLAEFELDEPDENIAIPLPAQLVQGWIDNPDQNLGLLFQSIDVQDVVYFSSAEAGPEQWRPLLVVRYLE